MSLVNLSHVCSHLQNASLARLGLTSIPYTRLHLSLALLLQKQGFLSQVKLAGPSPPASCFPPGMRENQRVTAHPHSERSGLNAESALQKMVSQGLGVEALRRQGFSEAAVEFAVEKREKTMGQLVRDGWAGVAAEFLIRYHDRTTEQLQEAGLDGEAMAIVEQYSPLIVQSKKAVLQQHGERLRYEAEEAEPNSQSRARSSFQTQLNARLHALLLREGFDIETLRYFAGAENRYITARELAEDGITLNAMGLEIENQHIDPPLPEQYEDPWDLETEGLVTQSNRASRRLWLGMKYWEGMPVLRKAKMISKPTKRIWLGSKELRALGRGRRSGEVQPLTRVGEVMAVSTDLGVLDVREAVERRVGGLVLCRMW